MSFGNQSLLSAWQKIGCLTYLLGAGFAVFYFAVLAAISDCASNGCLPDPVRLILFPGSLIVAGIGGYFLTKFFMKDRN